MSSREQKWDVEELAPFSFCLPLACTIAVVNTGLRVTVHWARGPNLDSSGSTGCTRGPRGPGRHTCWVLSWQLPPLSLYSPPRSLALCSFLQTGLAKVQPVWLEFPCLPISCRLRVSSDTSPDSGESFGFLTSPLHQRGMHFCQGAHDIWWSLCEASSHQ